jgi:transposase
MSRKKEYEVKLSETERDHLKNLISAGTTKARKLIRARILLKADEAWTDEEISEALEVGLATPGRIRKRYVEDGFAGTLNGRPRRRQYEPKIDGKTEAHLIALVCGEPPEGYAHWSLRLLAAELVKLEQVELETVSHETVRQVLKKTGLNHGSNNNG